MVSSLYTLCIMYLTQHSHSIVDLEGIAYEPYIADLLKRIFSKGEYIHPSILTLIGETHGEDLRKDSHYGTIELITASFVHEQRNVLRYIATLFPSFVCRLNLSGTNVNDHDMTLLNGFTNLVVLDLGNTLVGDEGVAHLCRMAVKGGNVDPRRIEHLEILSLACNTTVTDKTLLYLHHLKRLKGIDLSFTSVTDVSLTYLSRFDFKPLLCQPTISPFKRAAYPLHCSALIEWESSLWEANSLTESQAKMYFRSKIQRNSLLTAYISRDFDRKEPLRIRTNHFHKHNGMAGYDNAMQLMFIKCTNVDETKEVKEKTTKEVSLDATQNHLKTRTSRSSSEMLSFLQQELSFLPVP
ncbi:hypothetical protein BDF14DRAFT_1857750 [Spinellus fusiger]|nr:hypothetical protein BDF14DRAFT_1857750 [Spinellus fusiger]